MLQRVALSVMAFVYFGFFLAHLTLLTSEVPAADVYRYLSFDQIAEFREAAANANIPVVQA